MVISDFCPVCCLLFQVFRDNCPVTSWRPWHALIDLNKCRRLEQRCPATKNVETRLPKCTRVASQVVYTLKSHYYSTRGKFTNYAECKKLIRFHPDSPWDCERSWKIIFPFGWNLHSQRRLNVREDYNQIRSILQLDSWSFPVRERERGGASLSSKQSTPFHVGWYHTDK